jgi:hypothetical protein
VLSSPIRIALTPDDEVIAVMGGALALFNPSDASVKPSREYARFLAEWRFSSTERDTVIAAHGNPTLLHRVIHTGETIDTATTIVGRIAIDSAGTDLEPLSGLDDPRLWTATTYCMPVQRRIELLNVSEATARVDQEACVRRVEQARAPIFGAR